MAAVGRTLARAFHVNEDLTETICLAHDVGHSPFGHRGEHVIDELMKGHGGFDHNLQSLRAVEKLEYAYPGFRGLNLSWEVRAGLLKHEAATPGAQLDRFPIGPFQMLEAQIADVADDMSYYAHDVDDGLEAGLISLQQLDARAFWRLAAARTHEQYANLERGQFMLITIRNLLDLQVNDVINEGERRIEKHRPQTVADAMNAPERLIAFSDEMAEMLKDFADFLYHQLYFHPGVADDSIVAVELMQGLFLHYI
jgi:dGTPase